MADKKSLFGMDSDDLADALEAIYKKQKSMAEDIEAIKIALLAAKTTVHVDPEGGAGEEDDGIPPLVKWALAQPWGAQLMHGLTDQEMISGLVKAGLGWLKDKAAAKMASGAGGVP